MKYLNLSHIATTGFLGLSLLAACNSNRNDGCVLVPNLQPPISVSIGVRDKQNRDLLAASTPGHYDTAQISQLNKGTLTVRVNTGKAYLFFYPLPPGQITSYIKLNPTDQDTVLISIEREQQPCYFNDRFKSFSYNGQARVDSLPNSNFKIFNIVK